MLRLIKFELKKFFRSPKNLIIIVIFFALLSGYLFLMNQSWGNFALIEDRIELNNDLNNLSYNTNNEAELKNLENGIKLLDQSKTNGIYSDEYLNWNIQYESNKMSDEIKNNKSETIISKQSRNKIQVDKYLLENKVAPQNNTMSTSGLFLVSTISFLIPIFYFLLIFLFSGDIFNKEYQGGSYKLIFIQPFSRTKIITAKYFAAVLGSIISILGILLPIFLFNGITKGFGNFDYPVELANNYLSLSINSRFQFCNLVPLSFYFAMAVIVLLVSVFAISALSLFFALAIKNRALCISLLSLISIGFFVIYYFLFMIPLPVYNIFSYCNIVNVLSATYFTANDPNPVTFLDAVIVSAIYTALFLGASILVSKHKQYAD